MNKYAFYFAQEAFEVEYILLWLLLRSRNLNKNLILGKVVLFCSLLWKFYLEEEQSVSSLTQLTFLALQSTYLVLILQPIFTVNINL